MDYNEYRDKIIKTYEDSVNIENGGYLINVLYNDIFKWEWLATKLKMFSFISYKSSVSEEDIKDYADVCYEYARKNYKGLPRGLQNVFTSFAVVASNNISKEAIEYVQKSPTKHFAAFEMPILYDLSTDTLYFYRETPIWGAIYYKYFREYIINKFSGI